MVSMAVLKSGSVGNTLYLTITDPKSNVSVKEELLRNGFAQVHYELICNTLYRQLTLYVYVPCIV
jgi:hypothetical protein